MNETSKPTDESSRPKLTAEQREQLEALRVKDPEELLAPAERTGVGKWLGLSVVAHVVIIALTSVGLFAAWAEHGVHMPATLKQLQQEQADQEKIKAQQAAAEAAKQQDNGDDNSTTGASASSSDEGKLPTDRSSATETDNDPPTPPPAESVDPLEEFDLDDSELGL